MNTKLIVGIIVVVIIGGGWYASSQKNDAMMQKANEAGAMMEKEGGTETEEMTKGSEQQTMESAMMEKEDDAMMEKDTMMMSEGTYELYAPEKISWASTDHDVILFFKASWCPTCRAVDANIKAHLASIPADLTILEVNYDDSTALKQKYGVTTQHTFVQVDAAGNLIKKWTGSPTLEALVAEIK